MGAKVIQESAKEAIKSAAIELFAEHGFSGTSVRDIAQLAGVNVAAVNYHFGSKDGLFQTVFEESANDGILHLISLLSPPKDFSEFEVRLKIFIEAVVEYGIHNPKRIEMVYRNIEDFAEMCSDVFHSTFGKMHNALQEFLNRAQVLKIIREDVSSLMIAHFLMSSVNDIVRHRDFRRKLIGFSIEDQYTRQEYVSVLMACFLHGVKRNEE